MNEIIEIESFLYSCGARLKEITKYHRVYEIDPIHYELLLNNLNRKFYIVTVGGEGIIVELTENKILFSERYISNAVYFYWPTDRATLCQIINILSSVKICEGLTKEECRAFKRFLVARLME